MRNNFYHSLFTISIFILIVSSYHINPIAAQPEISIHYLGHSSFVIKFDNGISVLTDYGTSNSYGLASPIYDIGDFKPDIVTFSHRHPDHYNPERLPDSIQYILMDFDSLEIEGLKIRPVLVAETNLSNRDNSCYIFTYKGLTVVHLADAQANIMNISNPSNRTYLKEILPDNIDLLFMTIEGVSQFIPEAELFVDFIKPKMIIPMHYWSRQYKLNFLDHLEAQHGSGGKNYQIERSMSARFFLSVADTSTIPVRVISLEPEPFSDFDKPDIRYEDCNLDDGSGNNNQRADAGETVSLVITLKNYWLEAANVSVTLSTDNPEVQIITATASYDSISKYETKSNQDNPFVFSVHSATIANYKTFYLDISAEGGYSKIDSFEIIIGTPTVLLIDDDAGESFESHYTKMMIPEVWNVATSGCPSIEMLKRYEQVIWSTGNDRENTLTQEEQTIISAFLEYGGKLLITGQNIASDLVGDGSSGDSTFFVNNLHSSFVSDSTTAVIVLGMEGDPITGGMTFYIAPTPRGEGNLCSPDIIDVIAPAEMILKYVPGFAGAGLKYEDQTSGSRLVYLPFGIEKIIGPKPTTSAELVEKILNWLAGTTPVTEHSQTADLPEKHSLSQNYPNPFNSSTTIKYSIPETGFVTLKIYNLLGKELTTIINKVQNAGTYYLTIDCKDLPSGIYFYQLQVGSYLATKKFVLIR